MLDLMERTGKAYLPYAFYPEKAEFNNALCDYTCTASSAALNNPPLCPVRSGSHGLISDSTMAAHSYQDESFFESTWSYSCFKKPVSLFSLSELDDRPIFQLLQTSDTYIQGDRFTCKTSFVAQL